MDEAEKEGVLLRPCDVARRLAVSKSQAYWLINEGHLPSVRVGLAAVRVPETGLNAFIAKNTTDVVIGE